MNVYPPDSEFTQGVFPYVQVWRGSTEGRVMEGLSGSEPDPRKETRVDVESPQEGEVQPAAEVSEKKVVSRRPAKRTQRASAKGAKRTRRAVKKTAAAEARAEKTAEEAEPQPKVQPAESGGEAEPPQDARRSRPRRPRRRRSSAREDVEADARQDSRGSSSPGGISQAISEILSETWTEDRARKLLSEGFLTMLATPLVTDGPVSPIDTRALAERLEVIRKVLADECMVEDDATDVILLDMVMNALADRIEVYRLALQDGRLEDVGQVLELRYKADRRLIETVVALKNA